MTPTNSPNPTSSPTSTYPGGAGLYEVGPGKPFSTIQSAVNQLIYDQGSAPFTRTQTIEVYSGTYHENVALNGTLQPTSNYRLVITAAPGNNPVLDGQSAQTNGIFVESVNYVTISGFTCINYYGGTTDYGNGIYFEWVNSGQVFGNICYDDETGIQVSGGSNCSVYNNQCYSCSSDGIYIIGGPDSIFANYCYSAVVGIESDFSNVSSIFNNLCRSNSLAGISLEDSQGDLLSNNDLISNYYDVLVGYSSTNTTCENNILYGGSYGIDVDSVSESGFVSNKNDFDVVAGFWGSNSYSSLAAWQTASGQDAQSISADPQVVNGGGTTPADFKLTGSSPCIGAGINQSSVFNTDYFGNIRVNPWDIGFHAYNGLVPTPTATVTPTSTISNTYTDSPTVSDTPTRTATKTPSPSATPTSSGTPSLTLTATSTPSATRTFSPTATSTGTMTESFTATGTFTPSPTTTSTPTETPTASDTPTSTATPTGTDSPTTTPSSTITLSFTITPTFSVSPTFSASPTATPTATASPTPAYAVSGLGKDVLAPVPVGQGQPVRLYFSQPPAGSQWQVYDVDGELVASLSFTGPVDQYWDTSKAASGIYLIRIQVVYADGEERREWFKAVVLR